MASLVKLAPAGVRVVARLLSRQVSVGEAPLPPPARRSERTLAVVAHRGFNFSLLISGALVFGLLAIGTQAAWLDWSKLGLGFAMTGEGFLLATDWRGARRLTLWRLRQQRSANHQTRASLRRRLAWRVASPALQLLGVTWLAAGTLTAVLGLERLV